MSYPSDSYDLQDALLNTERQAQAGNCQAGRQKSHARSNGSILIARIFRGTAGHTAGAGSICYIYRAEGNGGYRSQRRYAKH